MWSLSAVFRSSHHVTCHTLQVKSTHVFEGSIWHIQDNSLSALISALVTTTSRDLFTEQAAGPLLGLVSPSSVYESM